VHGSKNDSASRQIVTHGTSCLAASEGTPSCQSTVFRFFSPTKPLSLITANFFLFPTHRHTAVVVAGRSPHLVSEKLLTLHRAYLSKKSQNSQTQILDIGAYDCLLALYKHSYCRLLSLSDYILQPLFT